MKKYMIFLEDHAIEKHFYTMVNEIYSGVEWEVQWNKSGRSENAWGLKRKNDTQWSYHNVNDFIEVVNKHKLDVAQLEEHLASYVKSMIAYLQMIQKEASKQLGEDFVVNAVEEFEAFSNKLVEAIKQILPNIKSGKNIETGLEDKPSKSHLRVLDPN